MTYIVIAFLGFAASLIGAICGIGGGVIIKPILDISGLLPVSVTSFLSSVIVFSMSAYSVIRCFRTDRESFRIDQGLPLSIGAVIGGITGKTIFNYFILSGFNSDRIGAAQAGILFFLISGTLLYMTRKDHIQTHFVTNGMINLFAGFLLGILSAFLGVGGGPFNLMVLHFLFSMDAKIASRNSLLIILFSQIAGLVQTAVSGAIPACGLGLLILGVAVGLSGGILGRLLNKKLKPAMIDRLFIGTSILILCICIMNFVRFLR